MWTCYLRYVPPGDRFGGYLHCKIPNVLLSQTGPLQGVAGVTASLSIECNERDAVCILDSQQVVLKYGTWWGESKAAPLEVENRAVVPGQVGGTGVPSGARGGDEKGDEAALLAPWAKYLGPGGKLTGTLTFFRPKGSQAVVEAQPVGVWGQ